MGAEIPLREYAHLVIGSPYDDAVERAWDRNHLSEDTATLPEMVGLLRKMFKLGYASAVRDVVKTMQRKGAA